MDEEEQTAIRKSATDSAVRHFEQMAELLPPMSDAQRRLLLLSIEGGFYDGLVVGSKSMSDNMMAAWGATEALIRARRT